MTINKVCVLDCLLDTSSLGNRDHRLLVRQEKQFEDIILGLGNCYENSQFVTIDILWIEKWNCRIIKSKRKVKVPLKPVAIHDFIHSERFLLFFSPALFLVPFANVLSDIFQIKSGCVVFRMHLNHSNSLYIGREMFLLLQAHNVQASWPPAEIFVVCSSAAFWLRQGRCEALTQLVLWFQFDVSGL